MVRITHRKRDVKHIRHDVIKKYTEENVNIKDVKVNGAQG